MSAAAASSSLFAAGAVPRTTAAAGASPSRVPIRYLTCDDRFVDARPDWSWSRTSFEIAFSSTSDLYLLDASTRQALLVDCQASVSIVIDTLSYPSWADNGSAIVMTNYSEKALQHQRLLAVSVPPIPPDPFTTPCPLVLGDRRPQRRVPEASRKRVDDVEAGQQEAGPEGRGIELGHRHVDHGAHDSDDSERGGFHRELLPHSHPVLRAHG